MSDSRTIKSHQVFVLQNNHAKWGLFPNVFRAVNLSSACSCFFFLWGRAVTDVFCRRSWGRSSVSHFFVCTASVCMVCGDRVLKAVWFENFEEFLFF